MDYLWTKDLTPPVFPALDGDRDTDVLVIGGGMAGVLCAAAAKRAGAKCMLVEAKRIGMGITRGTTAVLSALHDTLYQDIVRRQGEQRARQYFQANLRAVEAYRALAGRISCDFEEKAFILCSRTDRERMEREAQTLQELGARAAFLRSSPMPFPVAGAVKVEGMAQFHPLKLLYGLARELDIREDTFVERLEGTTAHTNRGVIRAGKVIVATHYPFLDRRGLYFMKMYQQRSFVIALEGAADPGCVVEEEAEQGIYLRTYGKLLLVGGGSRRTGKPGEDFALPRAFARRYFPRAKERFAWANQDCVTLDGLPYIGPYSPNLPGVYVATGFNLWGMTGSMVAAELLGELLEGRTSPFAHTFAPGRPMPAGPLAAQMGESALHFARPTVRRCSHLGCGLVRNEGEGCWECPCHGSRFDTHGGLIDGPAQKPARVE